MSQGNLYYLDALKMMIIILIDNVIYQRKILLDGYKDGWLKRSEKCIGFVLIKVILFQILKKNVICFLSVIT